MGSVPRWEDPLGKGIATHSGILAWRILRTEEPGGPHSPWGHTVSDRTEAAEHACMCTIRQTEFILKKVASAELWICLKRLKLWPERVAHVLSIDRKVLLVKKLVNYPLN